MHIRQLSVLKTAFMHGCEKTGTLAVAKRRLMLLMTDQQRAAFLLPRPLTHLIGFQCLKRARHQRCACQSAGSHFQIHLSPLFITDKQTFPSVRKNTRQSKCGAAELLARRACALLCIKKEGLRSSAHRLDDGAECIQKSGKSADAHRHRERVTKRGLRVTPAASVGAFSRKGNRRRPVMSWGELERMWRARASSKTFMHCLWNSGGGVLTAGERKHLPFAGVSAP